jgi:tetratricopeptide (TPR) repeat protein
MYNIAKERKSDSLLATTYHAIGNMLVHKSDYNFALSSYFKALEYAKDDFRRGRAYAAAGYAYMLTGNTELGYHYVRKADSISSNPFLKKVINIFSGVAFNNFKKPDSALVYLKNAETDLYSPMDPTMNSVLLGQLSRSYELKEDNDLADVYYKKTLAYCKNQKLVSSYIRNANRYTAYLVKRGDYKAAKNLSLEILSLAQQTISNDGISNVAEILKKIYSHANNRDSAFYYAEMQIAYKDSVSNQKRIAEFQNITFAQQLKDIDEQAKAVEESVQRKQNLQYAFIALGIILFIIFYLLLSRSFITNAKLIEFFGVIALLIVFEFLNLLLHPFLERITHHSPVLMLFALVLIAALLVPLHHKLEKWATAKLVEKNKKMRLAAAKKTIQELETKPGNSSA